MSENLRWFGETDTVSLEELSQTGCSGIVTALHHIPVGETWTIDEIRKRKQVIEAAGLSWRVIESLPVHEDIKRRSGGWSRYIENYKQSIRNVAACGLEVVTYNFMPVLDWVRTDVAYRLPDGKEALRFEKDAFAAFDLFVLKRPDAEHGYTAEELEAATKRFRNMDDAERKLLERTALLGLPGSNEAFTAAFLQSSLAQYHSINEAVLRENLYAFLQEVTPVASECGIKMAIHPDDPPFPVLGLPRVVSTREDIRQLLDAAPNPGNGLCFCTGSFGARPDNDILSMLNEFADRVHFLHLRNTKRDSAGNFYEADHLSGDTNMAAVVETALGIMKRSGNSLPMRPDHGHRMLADLEKDAYPGYSLIGRLKGLAELRGLEAGIVRRLTG